MLEEFAIDTINAHITHLEKLVKRLEEPNNMVIEKFLAIVAAVTLMVSLTITATLGYNSIWAIYVPPVLIATGFLLVVSDLNDTAVPVRKKNALAKRESVTATNKQTAKGTVTPRDTMKA